jgi:hypothetical protein
MPLAEGVSARIVWKQYDSGVISPNTQPAPQGSGTPGAADGQVLRRVSSTLGLARDNYQSQEVRSDRQIADFRLGTKRVSGNISGEMSADTYWDFFLGVCRSVQNSSLTADQSDLTSIATSAVASTITFGGGDPIAVGFRVGDLIIPAATTGDDNTKSFVIRGFSGTSNRVLAVSPPPGNMTADTSFSVARTRATQNLLTGHISRKYAFEIYNEDIDVARLFTECRLTGFRMNLPATGLSTIEFDVMGRDMWEYTSSNAPFFASPDPAGTQDVLAAVNGVVSVAGSPVGVITGISINMDLAATADPVVGQNFVPEIFLGRVNVTGQVTAFFENLNLIQNFVDEDDVQIIVFLNGVSTGVNTSCVAITLPRVRFTGADVPTQGEGGQLITMPFQALLYGGDETVTGIPQTTFKIADDQTET